MGDMNTVIFDLDGTISDPAKGYFFGAKKGVIGAYKSKWQERANSHYILMYCRKKQ